MTLIADGLLLAAALAAIFYCWAVNRRLGNLHKQSSDLTSKLGNLDRTVSEVRAAIAESRSLAEQERARLGDLMENADRVRRDLRNAASVLEKSGGATTSAPVKPAKPVERESSLARVKRINRTQQRRDVS